MFICIAKKLNQLYKFYDIAMFNWQLLVNLLKPMRFMSEVDSWMQSVSGIFSIYFCLVQSLNSTFFPPYIWAEPGRTKEESRITCMPMLRTPPFFPPKSGEKPYLEVLSRFGLWRDFLNDNIQATISIFRLIKNMSIIPDQWNVISATLKPIRFVFLFFLSHYQR